MTLTENVQEVDEDFKDTLKSIYDAGKSAVKKGVDFVSKHPESLVGAIPVVGPALLWRATYKNWDDIKEYFSTYDTHDWLSLIEITTGLLGLIPTPASPVLLGISAAAGVSDAYVYYKEGDKYMAGIMLILSVIPGGELVSILKKTNVFSKKGSGYVAKLLKKSKAGKTLTEVEQKELKEIAETMTENAGEVKGLLKKGLKKSVVAYLKDKTPKWMANALARLIKTKAYKASKVVFKTGGLIYGFDKLYLFINRDYAFNQSNLDNRTKNELRMMVNTLLKNEEAVNEYIKYSTTNAILQMAQSNPDAFKIEVDESPEEYFEKALDGYEKELGVETNRTETADTETTSTAINTSPKTTDVLSRKINPQTKKPFVIKRGQKGDSVGEIQKLLDYLSDDYGNILRRGMDEIESGVDSKFGPNTFDTIKKFQEDNNLKVDGIVGSETLTKLKELTK
jgi:murein L,D-transpeptidase YcbB/YkuD